MEAVKVMLDFEFADTSAEYGKFLTMCHESIPDLPISNVRMYYAPKTGYIRVGVFVPKDFATALLLTFGQHRIFRPEPKKSNLNYDLDIFTVTKNKIWEEDYSKIINYKSRWNKLYDE